MARGRKPKSAKVVELQGAAHHKAPVVPPPADPGGIEPPDWFGEEGLFAWRFWTDQMKRMGTLYKCDGLALQGACHAYERAVGHAKRLKGDPTDWRADVACTRAWKQVKDFATEFGLTLVSRSRVNMPGAPPEQMEFELEKAINQ